MNRAGLETIRGCIVSALAEHEQKIADLDAALELVDGEIEGLDDIEEAQARIRHLSEQRRSAS